MKRIFSILIIPFLCISCSVKSRPIESGKDNCEFCKMTVMEKKFAAEIVTDKGRVFTFDDIGCMINYLQENKETASASKLFLVSDFFNENELIDVRTAYLYRSDSLGSPMNGNIAAHKSKESFEKMKAELSGSAVQWNDLLK